MVLFVAADAATFDNEESTDRRLVLLRRLTVGGRTSASTELALLF